MLESPLAGRCALGSRLHFTEGAAAPGASGRVSEATGQGRGAGVCGAWAAPGSRWAGPACWAQRPPGERGPVVGVPALASSPGLGWVSEGRRCPAPVGETQAGPEPPKHQPSWWTPPEVPRAPSDLQHLLLRLRPEQAAWRLPAGGAPVQVCSGGCVCRCARCTCEHTWSTCCVCLTARVAGAPGLPHPQAACPPRWLAALLGPHLPRRTLCLRSFVPSGEAASAFLEASGEEAGAGWQVPGGGGGPPGGLVPSEGMGEVEADPHFEPVPLLNPVGVPGSG